MKIYDSESFGQPEPIKKKVVRHWAGLHARHANVGKAYGGLGLVDWREGVQGQGYAILTAKERTNGQLDACKQINRHGTSGKRLKPP